MINIDNHQEDPVNLGNLKKNAQAILNHLGYANFDLGIMLCDDKTMHEYNKKYRGKDKSTDVLSFANFPDLKAGEQIIAKSEYDKDLGDIILCPSYIRADLERWEQDFETRMRVLLVHGICHLLGYDHIEDEDYTKMHAKETELLEMLGKK